MILLWVRSRKVRKLAPYAVDGLNGVGVALYSRMQTPPCPRCRLPIELSDPRNHTVRFGSFRRASDNSKQRRYRCKTCGRTFSDASFSAAFGQKKRQFNGPLIQFFASACSQRRLAINFRLNRKTVVRKFLFLGKHAAEYLRDDLLKHPKAQEVEFDDLETFEHSKMKPLSVCAVVESGSRRILGFNVAQMPAKGRLAEKSRAKYGHRPDERGQARDLLFEELKGFIEPTALIKSDQNPHYGPSVKKHFPNAIHETFKGRRGCVVGQGELKAGGFDPLFTLNHTYAMFRANINRLARRTWNTTKKKERLALHIALYSLFHNWKLIPEILRPASAIELLQLNR